MFGNEIHCVLIWEFQVLPAVWLSLCIFICTYYNVYVPQPSFSFSTARRHSYINNLLRWFGALVSGDVLTLTHPTDYFHSHTTSHRQLRRDCYFHSLVGSTRWTQASLSASTAISILFRGHPFLFLVLVVYYTRLSISCRQSTATNYDKLIQKRLRAI